MVFKVSKYTDMLSNLIQSKAMDFSGSDIPSNKIVGGGIIHVQASIRTALEGVGTKFMGTEQTCQNAVYFNNNLLPVWRRRNKNASPKVFEMPSILEIKKEGL